MPDRAALLGTWRMVSWQREVLATGERTDALGPEPVGYFTYGVGATPLCRATDETVSLGSKLSSMIRSFCSVDHCRRRAAPVITSIR